MQIENAQQTLPRQEHDYIWSGWFCLYFSQLCAGASFEQLDAATMRDATGQQVYSKARFIEDLAFLVWQSFDGAHHPKLGTIRLKYVIVQGDYSLVTHWDIACSTGKAAFYD